MPPARNIRTAKWVMHASDGGKTWNAISMAAHANLSIDTYFVCDLHGWVVGGKGGTTYDKVKPVIISWLNLRSSMVRTLRSSTLSRPSRSFLASQSGL